MRQLLCSFVLFISTLEAIPMLLNKPFTGGEKFSGFDYMEAPKSESLWPLSFSNEDLFRNLRNMDVDGVEAQSIPDEEKALAMFGPKYMQNFGGLEETSRLPQMPFDGIEDRSFNMDTQPGVAPKFTGTFVTEKPKEEKEEGKQEMSIKEEDLKLLDPDYIDAPVINPANYFLEGADLAKVPAPKCQMIGCTGPHVNDGSFTFDDKKDSSKTEQCHSTFVPLNGCLDGKGYPMGMVCQICCDCANSFVAEMQKSRGFRTGYKDPHH
ncbi:unnamed protein product, partial [Mesorhabditis belari]|uniref:Uncharacterized protein n=1 Tax=Mesorhabditis belari TaxID=2138241 RepID=A0AAF3F0P8_9BILA